MKIIFWEDIVSAHQSFLIRELSYRHEVILAVLKEDSERRLVQGWKRPDTGNAKIVILENKKISFDLLSENKNAIHLFTGIASYRILKDVFKKLDTKALTGVLVEAGSPLGWKKYLRKPLYFLKYLRYNKKIDFIFAMGDLGVNWYRSVGFPEDKIHKFQYFTELPDIHNIKQSFVDNIPNLLFIGLLIDRKNIQGLIEALVNLKDLKWKLDILGDGPLRATLENLIIANELDDRVTFHGNMENNQAMMLLSSSDYLVLPSNFDGWGAVVNEALSRGVKVITNEMCGASSLVKEMNWGIVYKDNSKDRLKIALKSVLTNFKKESLVTRKQVATEFSNTYTHKIIDDFEQILLSKWID